MRVERIFEGMMLFVLVLCCTRGSFAQQEEVNSRTSGIEAGLIYKADYLSDIAGGVRCGGEYLDNLSLQLRLDAHALMGWKGATMYFHVLSNHGGAPSDHVGDLQGVSNIQAVSTTKLFEGWLQQSFGEERFSVLVGLYDLNSEFYYNEPAGMFLNSSSGIGAELAQVGPNGPSIFPTTSMALRLKFMPSDSWYAQAVVMDGVPGDPDNPHGTSVKLNREDGAFVVAEGGYLSGGEGEEGPRGKYGIGAWYHSGPHRIVDEDMDAESNLEMGLGNRGAYVLAEQDLCWNGGANPSCITAFGRIGFADAARNMISHYLGFGIVASGFLPGDCRIGFAVAQAGISRRYKHALALSGVPDIVPETTYELTAHIPVSSWLVLQPDAQFVHRPSGTSAVGDALVVGTRLEIAF